MQREEDSPMASLPEAKVQREDSPMASLAEAASAASEEHISFRIFKHPLKKHLSSNISQKQAFNRLCVFVALPLFSVCDSRN